MVLCPISAAIAPMTSAGPGSITHPPSGHRIRLADRVDLDGPALHFLAERCRYHVGRIAVQEVLVGLVADQIDAPLDRQLGHGPHLVRVHDDPGRVIRAVQEDRACARGDVRLEVGPGGPGDRCLARPARGSLPRA